MKHLTVKIISLVKIGEIGVNNNNNNNKFALSPKSNC